MLCKNKYCEQKNTLSLTSHSYSQTVGVGSQTFWPVSAFFHSVVLKNQPKYHSNQYVFWNKKIVSITLHFYQDQNQDQSNLSGKSKTILTNNNKLDRQKVCDHKSQLDLVELCFIFSLLNCSCVNKELMAHSMYHSVV